MKRRIGFLLTGLVLLALLVLPAAAQPPGPPGEGRQSFWTQAGETGWDVQPLEPAPATPEGVTLLDGFDATKEDQTIDLINQARIADGKCPLKKHSNLTTATRNHSQDMAVNNFFSHYNRAGQSPGDRIIAAGYGSPPYENLAENIGAGHTTAAAQVSSWMASPGHQANILDPDSREIGVGYYYQSGDTGNVCLDEYPPASGCTGSTGGPYYHYWTANFGSRPDVFPIFIDNDAATTTSQNVTLCLTNASSGWNSAEEVRFSNDGVSYSAWQAYGQSKSWTLTPGTGTRTVYVQYRDTGGSVRTTSSDTIQHTGGWSWERLSANAGVSVGPAIGVSGNNVHVVWEDTSPAGLFNAEIFYKRSTDNGATWTWQQLSTNAGWSADPAIAVSGNNVHVVWEDDTPTGGLFNPREIFYKRSTDNGNTWTWQRLSYNAGWSVDPAIAVSGSNVHVVWEDTTLGNDEIFYKRSTNNGATWAWQRLSSNAGSSALPAIAVSGSNVHVVWQDNSPGNFEIFYKRSTNNGATWSWQRLSSNVGYSLASAIAAYGSNVHVVWQDDTLGANREVFYKRSTNNGSTWIWQRLSSNAGKSEWPAVAVSGSNAHVVWEDDTPGNDEIFYKRSTDNGSSWTWQRLSNNTGTSLGPAIAVNSNVHVVWRDDTPGNYEIFYKRGP